MLSNCFGFLRKPPVAPIASLPLQIAQAVQAAEGRAQLTVAAKVMPPGEAAAEEKTKAPISARELFSLRAKGESGHIFSSGEQHLMPMPPHVRISENGDLLTPRLVTAVHQNSSAQALAKIAINESFTFGWASYYARQKPVYKNLECYKVVVTDTEIVRQPKLAGRECSFYKPVAPQSGPTCFSLTGQPLYYKGAFFRSIETEYKGITKIIRCLVGYTVVDSIFRLSKFAAQVREVLASSGSKGEEIFKDVVLNLLDANRFAVVGSKLAPRWRCQIANFSMMTSRRPDPFYQVLIGAIEARVAVVARSAVLYGNTTLVSFIKAQTADYKHEVVQLFKDYINKNCCSLTRSHKARARALIKAIESCENSDQIAQILEAQKCLFAAYTAGVHAAPEILKEAATAFGEVAPDKVNLFKAMVIDTAYRIDILTISHQ